MSELKKYLKSYIATVHQCTLRTYEKTLRQVVKTCIKIAFASALLLIISGVLSYAIKGKVIAILEIIAGIIAFCAVIL